MYLVVKAKFIFGVHCLLVNILGFCFVLVCLCVIFKVGTIEILETKLVWCEVKPQEGGHS
jgi:hypothetical protein